MNLTPDEYLSPDRFPLTSCPGLSLDQQMLIDAIQYDELRDKQEAGVVLAGNMLALRAELARKVDDHCRLRRWG
jgi:hypothetical protein